MVNGAIRYENVFRAGEEISLRPRIRNTGGSPPPAGASVHLDVWLDNAGGRRRIYSGDLPSPDPLRFSSVDIPLGTGSGLGGGNIVTAEITVDGMDDDPADNRTSAVFHMEETGEETFSCHFSPNPIDRSFPEAMFCINTTEEVNLNLEIYSLEGSRLGSAKLGSAYGTPVTVGLSCHSCADLFPGIHDLASGIYLYRMVVSGAGGQSKDYQGRFAVER
jgi:hypothetical protein